jgi:hypothetical protein
MTDGDHPAIVFKIVERELLSFASDSNARKLLSKYGVNVPDEKMEKALVIWSTELRHVIEKIRESLPEDAVEANAAIARKRGPSGPRSRGNQKK